MIFGKKLFGHAHAVYLMTSYFNLMKRSQLRAGSARDSCLHYAHKPYVMRTVNSNPQNKIDKTPQRIRKRMQRPATGQK
jgi:hypothetical protein